MRDVVERLAKLPPEKRALLLRALEERGDEWSTFPLSFAQQRLWFLDRWEPGSPAYNLPAALRLRGALDLGALEASLGEITRRHEALRTVFLDIDGRPIQVVRDAEPFRIPTFDLQSLTVPEREARARALAAEEAARPFDLTRGPVFRATVLRLGEQDHVLLVTAHHIVADGWSIALLAEELSALYAAFSSAMPSPLSELPLQYGDFARWQREYLRGPTLEKDLAYWRRRLQDAPELLSLPTDRPRPLARSSRGAARAVVVRDPVASALRDLGRGERATSFMTLLATFLTGLYRITGQTDLVVGTPVAGRTRPETERLIGFFVNTLALRTDLSGDLTFRDVLRRVRVTALEALAHQQLPFERLVEEVRPERDPSRTPVFQVMFTVQNSPAPTLELPGLSVEPLDSDHVAAKFDWTLSVDEGDDGLHMVLVYSTDLFEGATIDRMLSCFVRVMEGVVSDPDRRVAEIPLLTGVEREGIVVGWNATRREYPRDRSLGELFEEQVRLRSEAVALVEEGRSWTYGELGERSRMLARRLMRMGVGAETRVGLWLDRSFEMVVGMLGIVRAGGAYVPLDPSYPLERLRWMAADAGVGLVLVRGEASARAELGGSVRIVSVGTVSEEGDDEEREEGVGERRARVCAETLAYVMYTSGSTGRPKGVGVAHRGVVRLVKGADYASLGSEEVFLQLAPISFDASVLEIWGSLLNGGRLVVMPSGAPSLEELGRAVERYGVTTLWLTAPLFHQMVEGHLGSLRGVRQLLSGGDVLWPRHVERVRRELPGCRMINGYGPTEGTTFACCHTVVEERFEGRSVPIGRPIANTRAYVLDGRMEPVPVGVPGELYLGGDGLARGYLGDAALTAERFVPDAVGAEAGGRLYKTGDRARYLEDGRLEFLGRLDEQVKIRGYRIEPGEIEEVLGSHPGVKGAAVVVREGDEGAGTRRLVAYVVPGSPDEIDGRSVREFLRERLPEYMVPSQIVMLEELPLTPSGKVDRLALPREEGAGEGRASAGARTPVEEMVAGIWSRVLGVERIGLEESFFELGGHSLLATQVISRVREAFRVELPMRWLFERPTVAGLATRIEELLRDSVEGSVPAIRPVSREGPLPLSFAQERLWFLDQLEPGSASYNVPMAVRMEGRLEEGVLARAFGEVMRRHEALRTRFAVVDGTPIQVIEEARGFPVAVEDLRGVREEEREEALRLRVSEEGSRPFDLTQGPLMRALLLRMGQEEHVLVVVLHHIVSDGWSLGVLVREMAELYGAYVRGEGSPLPELPVQYADFAVWQRGWLQGTTLASQLAYWKDKLGGAPAFLDLPTDRPRIGARRHRGDRVRVSISPEEAERLHALSRSEGATLFMTLLAAFEVLLFRHTGETDLMVGTPIAGRNRVEIEGLIGFFVNTLVLRTDLSGDPSFREVVRRIRETALGAYAHQDFPFEKLVEEIQPERDLSHTPLFQVMFSLQNTPAEEVELAGLRLSAVGVSGEGAKFELSLSMVETGEGLDGVLEYDRDLFERETIERMGGHLRRLLAGMGSDPGRRISELPILEEEEERRLLVEWQGTRTEYPRERCLHELFEERAERAPSAIAVEFEGERLEYGELEARANGMARHLREMGVGPEVRVGLMAERSIEMVVGLLGILKAGGAYVPLDPSYPKERLAFMLDDSKASVLLASRRLGTFFPNRDLRTVELDPEAEVIRNGCGDMLGPTATASNLAYVIYTSGSTGRSKGVMVEHEACVRHTAAVVEAYELTPADRVLQFGSLSFDVSVEQIFPTLAAGATLVPRGAAPWGASEFLRRVRDLDITVLNIPTAFWHVLIKEREPFAETVRLIVVGGEPMAPESAEFWGKNRRARARLLNGYGPTEAVVTATTHEIRPLENEVAPALESVPIGRALSGRTAYVLDSGLRLVPRGVQGELFLGGVVARGYLEKPELTAASFVPDPHSIRPGDRMYATGDVVRWRSDGTLEFIGRRDAQVKIRGFRIEPAEVEAELLRCPGVREAAVVVRGVEETRARPSEGSLSLAAYVVPRSSGAVEVRRIREFLRERLPEHMVPSEITTLEELPRTPSGKLDRRALPEPTRYSSAETESHSRPRSPVEQELTGMWGRLLGVQQVGIHEDFFELGGHSLLATQVVSRIRDVFGVEFLLRRMFEKPTIAKLAEEIEVALRAGAIDEIPPLRPVARAGPVPLSFAQERLWFLDQLEPGSASYNVPMAVRMEGRLEEGVLARAFGEVMRRHEALRTRFAVVDGTPIQVIEEARGFPVAVEDLGGVREEEREEALRLRVSEEGSRPFDLTQGPLMRALLLRMGQEEHVLVVVLHHIVSDGWSLGVLVREMAELYGAYVRGEGSPLPELPVQYADFAVWQRGWLQGTTLASQLAYWKDKLGGAPAFLDLPTDRPRIGARRHRGDRVRVSISPEEAERLHALSRSEGATLFMTLLAAFEVLLFRHTGETDLMVGTPIAGRNRVEIEGLIGFFVNTLVLRTDLSGDPSFREVVRRIRETALGAYAHQDFPFEKLVEEIQPERDLSHTPLFQVMFSLQNTPAEEVELAGLRLSAVGVSGEGAKFELSLSMVETGEGLDGVLEYDRDLFERETIERMGGHLRRLLAGMGSDPGRRISELPILEEEEERRLLVEWQGTRTEYPRERCLHELFEEQAERAPSAIAVEFEGERLEYGELEARANGMARHLREMGVGPEVRVGLMAERSIEMVVGLLGILKAGGAYVPLDPSYPKERLAFMLDDSKASVLLASRRLVERLPVHHAKVLDLETRKRTGEEEIPLASEALARAAWSDSVAYVMYTSGSSGRPKGVAVTHRGVVRLVRQTDYARFGPDETILQVATLGFDASTFEIWGALLNGARLVLMSSHVPSLDELGRAVEEAGVTTLLLTTPLFHQVVDGPIERFRGLRQLLTGGDVLSPAHARRARAALPGTRIINAYGPTEGTTITTCFGVGHSGLPDGSVAIGRPIANTRAHVLDRSLRPVPIGVVGEIFIGGDGLARGYLDHPDLTAERFVPDPFGVEPGTRLYRSGDLGRVRVGVGLEFLGRADRQVKIRGYRIEPEEIEETLSEHPRLREVAVAARTGRSGEKRLVAYVVANAPEPPTIDDLRTFLGARLPEYMVPGAIVYLDALPRTPSGKVDRRSLPEPGHEAFDAARPFVSPRTPLEEKLAALWREVLDLPRVSVRDDFFELGGHSLRAVQLVFRVRQELGTHLPVRAVFESRTIEELCRVLERAGDDAPRPGASAAHEVDLLAEAVLDSTIRPARNAVAVEGEPRRLLLTGATGFLGAFLAYELLLRTKAEILCLVRAPTPEEGRRRIREALQGYELGEAASDSRIIPVCGDLAQPRCGLSDDAYHALADSVDAVYHNAASVNFVQPYAQLRAPNVMGTVEVLRLAALSRAKQVEYVSTLSVFGAPAYVDAGWIREETLPERFEGLEGGYAQSKWVAERLILTAAERGIRVRIYRPGRVVGNTRTGASNPDDMASRFIRACIEIEAIPSGDVEFDLTPVDYVSAAIVHLSRQPWPNGACFHLVNPEPCRLTVLARAIRDAGYALDSLPYDAWRARLVEAAADSSQSHLLPLLSLLLEEDRGDEREEPEDTDSAHGPLRFDDRHARKGLSGSGIACAAADAQLLQRYISFFVRRGYLQAPPSGR